MNLLVVSEYSREEAESCLDQLINQLLNEGKSVACECIFYAVTTDLQSPVSPDVVIYDREISGLVFDVAYIFAPEPRAGGVAEQYGHIPLVIAPGIIPTPRVGIASRTKYAKRSKIIHGGLNHNGYLWQTRDEDLRNITGRCAKLNSLKLLNRVAMTDTSYLDSAGHIRNLIWTTDDNIDILFTVQEFLEFGIAVDEFVEDRYKEARATTN